MQAARLSNGVQIAITAIKKTSMLRPANLHIRFQHVSTAFNHLSLPQQDLLPLTVYPTSLLQHQLIYSCFALLLVL